MQYQQRFFANPAVPASDPVTFVLGSLSSELALDDDVLQDVKAAWQQICGTTDVDPESFLKFEARDDAVDEQSLE